MKKPQLGPASAWFVKPADEQTRRAFIALSQGVANAGQQITAVNWLVQEVCRTHDLSVRPDRDGGERATCVAEGRRLVGLSVIQLMNQSLVAARSAEPRKPKEKEYVVS